MSHYAKVESGVVVHVLRVPPETIMTAESAAAYVPVVEGVQEGWVQRGGQFLPPDPELTADTLRASLAAEYERRMQIIASGYPPSERESWPVQTQEARALLNDVHALTPWIDAAASARGIDREVLAQRIADKDAAYRVIHGALTGARQAIEDQINDAEDDPATLQLIDVTQGWPEW